MALTPSELTRTLKDMVEHRKAYRDHPWIQRYVKGELSRAQIRTWIEQHYCTVGDVYDILGPIYAGCPDPQVRVRILENLLEEETGKITGSLPHRELMHRLIEALGGSREEIAQLKPLPETVARRSFMQLTARTRPFYEAITAISLAGEYQFGDVAETYARTGETKYGLSREATAFWWVHAEADKEHGGTAFEIVSQWVRTDEEQRRVIDTLRQSLDLVWCWFDGFVRATA
jgi:pyrroloquinoline-quinone synthase